MDFIEKLFGLSPDNGDGSTEVMWLVALALAIAVAIVVEPRTKLVLVVLEFAIDMAFGLDDDRARSRIRRSSRRTAMIDRTR